MSIFDRRPGLRWAVPAGAAVLFVGGAALTPLAATADSGLEPRTAQELLVALSAPSTTAVSGTVVTKADLGLPGLPMGMMPSTGPMALASGENTLRVWTDGPDRQRLAMVERAAETTVVRNGQEAWVWSSADATADRYVLPERDGSKGIGARWLRAAAGGRAAEHPAGSRSDGPRGDRPEHRGDHVRRGHRGRT